MALKYMTDEIMRAYRVLFSKKEAEFVLMHMLVELGVFAPITDSQEDVALKNYGMRILQILGGGKVEGDAIKQFIARLIRQPLPEIQKED